jgi:hypothetical protein
MAGNYRIANVGDTLIRFAYFPIQGQDLTIVKRIQTTGLHSPQLRLISLIDSVVLKDEEIAATAVADPGFIYPNEGILSNKYSRMWEI